MLSARPATFRPPVRHRLLAAALALVTGPLAAAQSTLDTPAPSSVAPDSLDAAPQALLGERVRRLRQKQKTLPILVIVRNEAQFLKAVAAWELPEECFPVLIDDGSDTARENIARFARAFLPVSIVRWNDDVPPLPAEPDAVKAEIEKTLFNAWKSEDAKGMKAEWTQSLHVPTGVVVMSPRDPAWTGGLTLAAMRGQEIVWTSQTPGNVSDTMRPGDVINLLTAIEEGCAATGRTWDALGDDIEAVTLCQNLPSKITAPGSGGIEQPMALTDRLGRNALAKRWAFAGQIHGDAPTAAYRAMSSVFLTLDDAWAWDGYVFGSVPGPWSLKPISQILLGSPVKLSFDPGRQSAAEFRRATRSGIDSRLVYINTKGTMWNFEMSPGRLYSFDVPFLKTPSVVHFTHSFSAQAVEHRSAIAGRFLENGACAYIGSVDEPWLQAFVPGPDFFRRFLLIQAPLACCARYEDAPVWKINLFGDPLLTAGSGPSRLPPDLKDDHPLKNLASIETALKQQLKSGEIEAAASALVMLRRDKDAVRLCLAGLKPAAGSTIKPSAARLAAIGLPAAFRERDADAVLTLFSALPEAQQKDPMWASLIWQVGRPIVTDANPSRVWVQALAKNTRELCALDDLETLTPALRTLDGKPGIEAAWKLVIAKTTDPAARAELQSALTENLRR
ncbi:MAG: hypothetical protein J0L61_05535 [Planctomycetes bacterium]|nr:hypothetical protein [Planctomycetota bacterium]